MKTLYLYEFERHLRKAQLRTCFRYEPRVGSYGFTAGSGSPEIMCGFIGNELITRGAIFEAMAIFYHPVGRPDQAKVNPLFFDKPYLSHTGFHYLDETGGDAKRDAVCELAFNRRPDMMEIDASVLGSGQIGDWGVIYRDDYRTYCLQGRGRPDLVFDGLIMDWGCDYTDMLDEEGCLWIELTKYRTSKGEYVALKEQSVLQDQERLFYDRKFRIFSSETEADEYLSGEDIREVAREIEARIMGGHGH